MSTTKKPPRTGKIPTKTRGDTQEVLFDYLAAGKKGAVPPKTMQKFFAEAQRDFPGDPMLAELHALRAVRAYVRGKKKKGKT